ncbi:MAG: hypothetical protein HYS09_02895 [Chloroflexi bacterium]|nr:hypothetical protein [Chloroflexota bacterium]
MGKETNTATKQTVFEGLRAKLPAHILAENEPILAVAQAWGGPRALTFYGLSDYGAGLRFLIPPLIGFLIVPWLRFTGLVSLWLLMVTPGRLVAARRGGLTGSKFTGQVRSFNYRQTDHLKVTDSFLSGWLVEVESGGERVKYALMGYPRQVTGLIELRFFTSFKFADFANPLLDNWQKARN